MILTCPQCETRYQADAARLGAEGRKVRCAKCGNVWHQVAPAPQMRPGPAFFPVEDGETIVRSTEPAQRTGYAPVTASAAYATKAESPAARFTRPEGLAAVAGWAGLAALVAAIGWAVIQFRQEIATVWPQSASFYAAIGKPVNTRGLTIENVRYHSESDGGQAVLAVSGRLTNITSRELSVPPIRITLTDNEQRVLYDWSFSARVDTLRPGQAVEFLTRLTSPPSGARHLQVQFAENKE